MRDERTAQGPCLYPRGRQRPASTAARIRKCVAGCDPQGVGTTSEPGRNPDPPSSIDILSVGHHARESAAGRRSTGRAAPFSLLPEDAVLLHEVLDDLLLVAVDPSSEGHGAAAARERARARPSIRTLRGRGLDNEEAGPHPATAVAAQPEEPVPAAAGVRLATDRCSTGQLMTRGRHSPARRRLSCRGGRGRRPRHRGTRISHSSGLVRDDGSGPNSSCKHAASSKLSHGGPNGLLDRDSGPKRLSGRSSTEAAR